MATLGGGPKSGAERRAVQRPVLPLSGLPREVLTWPRQDGSDLQMEITGLPPDVPSIDHVQAKHDTDYDPPWFARGWCIIRRDISLAMGTPLAFVMDVHAAIWARNHWLVIAEIWVVIIRIVIPIIVAIDEPRHHQLSQIVPAKVDRTQNRNQSKSVSERLANASVR